MGSMKATKNATATDKQQTFFARYAVVLEACARFVHARAIRGHVYTPTADLARWIARDLPTLFKQTFGSNVPSELKEWRVTRMLQDASFLGAYEELDIRTVRGRGVTTVAKPRARGSIKLRLIKGGKR